MLEELGHAEKERSRFLSPESLPDAEEVHELREEDATFAGADGRLVKDSRFLDYRLFRLLALVRARHAAQAHRLVLEEVRPRRKLVVLFERHSNEFVERRKSLSSFRLLSPLSLSRSPSSTTT